MMTKKTPSLQKFFDNADIRNQWIRHKGIMDVYLRKTTRNGKCTLDIANVTVDEFKRGKNHFRNFVQDAYVQAQQYGYEQIYFENVINQKLIQKFDEKCNTSPYIWTKKDVAETPSYFLDLKIKGSLIF